MPTVESEPVTVECRLIKEGTRAILVSAQRRDATGTPITIETWLPKSLCTPWHKGPDGQAGYILPNWLATDRGLI